MKTKLSLQEKINALDEIAKKFEENSIDIERGIEEYEKAAKLLDEIKKELTGLELKIKKINSKFEVTE